MQNGTQANCLEQILEHNTVQQPIVHVRGDSETELDLLFSVLNNNEPKLPGQPYRNKNLPLSFFQPPGQKFGALSMSHSRDGSHEFQTPGHMTPPLIGNFQHSRSHSSPAQLPIGLSLPPPNTMANCSVVPPPHLALDTPSPLQQRWTNNKHNINNNVWPCDFQQQMLQSPQQPRKVANIPTNQMKASADLGALPPGWEQGLTAEGDVYFIDHINKTTSWNDPRLAVKKTPNSATTKARHPYVPASRQHMQSAQQRLPHNASPATLPPKPTNSSKNKVNLQQQFIQQIAKHNTPNNQQNIMQNNNQTNLNMQMAGTHDIGLLNSSGQVEAQALQAASIGMQLFGPPSNSLQTMPNSMASTQSPVNPTEQRIRIELEKLKKKKVPTATLR